MNQFPLLKLSSCDGSTPHATCRLEDSTVLYYIEVGNPYSVTADFPPDTDPTETITLDCCTAPFVVPPEFVRWEGDNYQRLNELSLALYAKITDLDERIESRLQDIELELDEDSIFHVTYETDGETLTDMRVEVREDSPMVAPLTYLRHAMTTPLAFDASDDGVTEEWSNTTEDYNEVGLARAVELLEEMNQDVSTVDDFETSHDDVVQEQIQELKEKIYTYFTAAVSDYETEVARVTETETAKYPDPN